MIPLSAGNLATTQAVSESLREELGSGSPRDLNAARTLFDATRVIGDRLRDIMDRDAKYVTPHSDASATFLFDGQITGMRPRLFLIYAAGNFVEASDRCPYLQIGENKYGKLIIDRAFMSEQTLEEACKFALLSFDAAMRSNLSVGPPIDLVRYESDSLALSHIYEFDRGHPYFDELANSHSQGLVNLVSSLPKLTF